MKTGTVQVKRDGIVQETFSGGDPVQNSNAAFAWLLRHQGQSVDWAVRHEGWEITEPAPDQAEAAAAEIAAEITTAARGSGSDPITWVTGNAYMPPLRSFPAAEAVYQDDEDGEDFAYLAELVEAKLAEADVALECPEWDNALYAVDLQRFEYVDDPGDHETLQQDWQPKADCCSDCKTGETS